ncbi:MAG TPA: hypothetical protein VN372_03410 [Methanospirillum sp.]|nr:hypothetical protein [Methanospirillum sp.]
MVVCMIEVITIIEGIIILAIGIALFFAMPLLITQLLGIVVILTGGIVISKGFIKELRNP